MKKSFLNIGLMLAMGLAAVTFNSCKSDEPNIRKDKFEIKAENIIGNTSDLRTAAITWWPYSETGSTYEIIAKVPFVNNGFTIHPPKILKDKYLEELLDGEDVPEGITISDRDARIFLLGEFETFEKDGFYRGYIWLVNQDSNDSKVYYALWIYADRDVSIEGKASVNFCFDEIWGCYYYNLEYDNMNLKKGWNSTYLVIDFSESLTTSTISQLWTTQKPTEVELKWQFEAADIIIIDFSTKSKVLKNRKSLFIR